MFFDADQGDGSCGSVVDISSIRGSGSSCCLYSSVPYDEENLACIILGDRIVLVHNLKERFRKTRWNFSEKSSKI